MMQPRNDVPRWLKPVGVADVADDKSSKIFQSHRRRSVRSSLLGRARGGRRSPRSTVSPVGANDPRAASSAESGTVRFRIRRHVKPPALVCGGDREPGFRPRCGPNQAEALLDTRSSFKCSFKKRLERCPPPPPAARQLKTRNAASGSLRIK